MYRSHVLKKCILSGARFLERRVAAADCYVIGIPVYDGVGLLDVSVPLERFNRWHQRARLVIPALPHDPAAVIARGRTRARRAGGRST